MKYTALQLHRMRRAIHRTLVAQASGQFPDTLLVESQLVTYMSNETTPEELDADAEMHEAERQKLTEEQIKRYRWYSLHAQAAGEDRPLEAPGNVCAIADTAHLPEGWTSGAGETGATHRHYSSSYKRTKK